MDHRLFCFHGLRSRLKKGYKKLFAMAKVAKRKRRLSNFLYWLRYRIGERCLRGFVAVFPWLPFPLLCAFTKLASHLTLILLRNYRKRMEQNLSLVMADRFPTAEGRRAVIRTAWRNFAQGVLETAWSVHASKEALCSMIALQGEEHLKRAAEKGKGIVALSAHLGNFALIGARLVAAGYPCSVVVKQPRDQGFARLIDHYRKRVGVKTISAKPRRESVRQILGALRQNEVVLLITDEFKSGRVKVEFLGRTSHAPRGPATLALRTGAAVLPMFMVREPRDGLTLHIGSEVDLITTGDLPENVAANTALFSRHLEMMVRRFPEQWNWLGFRGDGWRPRNRLASSQHPPPRPS